MKNVFRIVAVSLGLAIAGTGVMPSQAMTIKPLELTNTDASLLDVHYRRYRHGHGDAVVGGIIAGAIIGGIIASQSSRKRYRKRRYRNYRRDRYYGHRSYYRSHRKFRHRGHSHSGRFRYDRNGFLLER